MDLPPRAHSDRNQSRRDQGDPAGVGNFARLFTRVLLGGQVPHDDELEAGMRRGLERIRDLTG